MLAPWPTTMLALPDLSPDTTSPGAAEQRLTRQNGALIALTRSDALARGDLAAFTVAATEAAARTLHAARASVWFYSDDRAALECADLYDVIAASHSSNDTMRAANCPVYFAALDADHVIDAHDALADPRTREFAGDYLGPLGIGALLDVSIRSRGQVVGIVCIEHVGPPRRWAPDEQAFTASVADLVALAIETQERVRAEAELRRQEARFRSLIEATGDIVSILSPDGTMLYQSPSAQPLLGYDAEAMIGQNALGWIHRDDVTRVTAAIVRACEHPDEEVSVEYRFRTGDGGWRIFDSHGRNLLDNPAVGGIVVTSRDVTERRAAEAELARQRAELERSNRELEHFAYIASHDLQEPLRKIQAFGDRLASRYGPVLEDGGRDYLARIQNAAARMQVLINDLLALSRLSTRPQPFAPVDLARVAREVVSDLEARVQQSGATVEVGALPVVQGDALQLRQLLQNLIGNALKFHRAGVPPVVRVGARPVAAGDAAGTEAACAAAMPTTCELSVEDNGIGFDERYLDRIFDPFQRLHGRSEYEGTGMGLAICRKIVERHGGTIAATSTPGAGSTFIITLPLPSPEEA
jgi:PAS domain S-box-containing protein